MLTACTAGAEHVHFDILRTDIHFHIFGDFRHHFQRCKGSMTAAGRIEGGDTHQTVHTCFRLQMAVGVGSFDHNGGALEASFFTVQIVQQLVGVAVALGPVGVHAV